MESQLQALRQYAASGGSIVIIGNPMPWQRHLGHSRVTPLDEDLGAHYQLGARPPKLTNEVRRILGATAFKTNAGPNVLVKLERVSDAPDWHLHVVNRHDRWLKDEVEQMSNVTIALDAAAFGITDVKDVRAFSPDGPEFAEAHVATTERGPTLTLPRLSIYTVVTFRVED